MCMKQDVLHCHCIFRITRTRTKICRVQRVQPLTCQENMSFCVCVCVFLCSIYSHNGARNRGKAAARLQYKYSLLEAYYSSAQHVHIFQLCVNKCLEVIFFHLSLILFSQILHLQPTLSRPRRLASTLAVAACAAARQCVPWSTLEPWFLSCLASWG